MSAIRELNFASKGEGRLPLPDRCSLDVSCFEEPEIQQALAIAIEETLYVVAFAGIELQALDGLTVAADCRDATILCARTASPEFSRCHSRSVPCSRWKTGSGSSASHRGHNVRLCSPIDAICESASIASVVGAIIPAATQAAESSPVLLAAS